MTEEKLIQLISEFTGERPVAAEIGSKVAQQRDYYLEHVHGPRLRACRNYPTFHEQGVIEEEIPTDSLQELIRQLTYGIAVLEQVPEDSHFYTCHASFPDREWKGIICEKGVISGYVATEKS